jgi:hypothetical protein
MIFRIKIQTLQSIIHLFKDGKQVFAVKLLGKYIYIFFYVKFFLLKEFTECIIPLFRLEHASYFKNLVATFNGEKHDIFDVICRLESIVQECMEVCEDEKVEDLQFFDDDSLKRGRSQNDVEEVEVHKTRKCNEKCDDCFIKRPDGFKFFLIDESEKDIAKCDVCGVSGLFYHCGEKACYDYTKAPQRYVCVSCCKCCETTPSKTKEDFELGKYEKRDDSCLCLKK